MPKFQTCPNCSTRQELPAIFCSSCSTPLVRISKIFLTLFLTVTVTAYVLFGLYASQLLWPAPLYGYYVLLFVLFSLVVTRRYTLVTLRLLAWSSLLVYAMWFFWISGAEGLRLVTSDVRDLLNLLDSNTLSLCVAVGALVLEMVLLFFVLIRRFGYLTGYRLYFTMLAAGAFLARWAFTYSVGGTELPVSPRLSDWFAWAPEKEIQELLELVSVNLVRAVLAEMCIYSFVKSFRPANERFLKLESRSGLDAAKKGMHNPLLDASARVASAGLRAGLVLHYCFWTLFQALRDYLCALWRVVRRITADFLAPLASLGAAAFLLALLAEHSGAYIQGKASPGLLFLGPLRSSQAMMLACLVAIFFVQMIFLASVSKFSWRALWRCNTLLVLWVAPFCFAFFLFVSMSLVVTGKVLRRWDNESFPYHVGPFTVGSALVLAALVAYAAFQWRRLQKGAPAERAESAQGAQEAGPEGSAPEQGADMEG